MDAVGWYRKGIDHAARAQFDEARLALERAVHEGAGSEALTGLADVLAETGRYGEAVQALERAAERDPGNPAVALRNATFLPWVYRDVDDLERWRSRYRDRLARFAGEASRYRPDAASVLDLERTNFLLAYQGRDDAELQRTLGGALDALLRQACPQYFERRKRPARAKVRVGFASAFLYDCTVGRYFGSWIEGLDPARFEIVGFMLGAGADAYRARLARNCLAMQAVDLPVVDVAQRIIDAELDVLVYPEIGMEPRCRLLAGLRLAPRQLAAWGHPETTGSPEIDGYISCEAMEPPGASAHYTETLRVLPGIGVRYEAPAVAPPLSREELGIEAGRRAYACPHSAFKLHPDCDALFAGILERDPQGVLVLFHGQNAGPAPIRHVVERTANALTARGIEARGQLRVLPQLTPTDFRRALRAMDVVVDPPHWSGGNTALDAIAMGVPLVTVRGELMRSRQAAAMLDSLGAETCVASDVDSAAEIAVRIAGDAALRSRLSARLADGFTAAFGDRAPLGRLEEFLGGLA